MIPRSSPIFAPLSALYGASVRARSAIYRTGVFTVHKIDTPIISVGNLTTGGTGKTPVVEWIARAVRKESNRPVCILTRGYGRARPHERVVVSDGEQLLADAREGGDEPRLLAELLQDVRVAVISDTNRVSAARWARDALGSEVFVLDDGFQHLRLARDLDVVTIDATSPFGGEQQHLLPRGNLREHPCALARAHCIVITRADSASNLTSLRAEVLRLSENRPMFVSRVRTRALRSLSNSDSISTEDLSLSLHPVAAFCGLGNPQAFFKHLRGENFNLSMVQSFPDHHVYTQHDADEIAREAKASGARALLTTAKDAVKLRHFNFALPCYVVEIEIEFDDQEGLLEILRRVISK